MAVAICALEFLKINFEDRSHDLLVKLARRYAEELGRPTYECSDRVEVIGDPLHRPVHWVGRQWAVTAYGIERRDGLYPIQMERLFEKEAYGGWVGHMAGKVWCDLEDFAEALRFYVRDKSVRKCQPACVFKSSRATAVSVKHAAQSQRTA
jgi:hypothetical protein